LTSKKYAVMASAEVKVKPPQIALKWPEEESFSYVIYRRLAGEKEWKATPIATMDGKATGYIDNKVKAGVVYEYRIDRHGKGFIGRGYINCGTEIALVEQRGKVILLVDKSIAADLKQELRRLELDMIGDGWSVTRHDVARAAKVTQIKQLIANEYRKAPDQVRTVFLFGHIPVPYSGNIAPDGHKNHRGSWPADLYYGDMDGEWSDNKTHKYVDRGNQKNIPNDGKFDPGTIKPDSIELEVGRVDLYDMPRFKLSETELLRQYLNKDHFFRHCIIKAEPRGLIDDNFGSFRGEAFGSSAWRNFATFFHADKVETADFISTLHNKNYLWAYGNGGGSYASAGGIGTSTDFADKPPKAVFTTLFGSYFGDWNWKDNLLRAPLASSGYGLTCAWDGRPHWYFHHMAMGKNIGYSTLRTQNNHPFRDYLTCNNTKSSVSGKDKDSEWDYNPIHVALMGDPTLRMHPVEPPRNIQASRIGKQLKLTWKPVLTTSLKGYHVYVAKKFSEPFKRLTEQALKTNEFIIKENIPGSVYMVKTIVLTSGGSGSYFNSSQGVYCKLSPNVSSYQSLQLANQTLETIEDKNSTIILESTGGSDKILMWSTPHQPDHGRAKSLKNGKYAYNPNPDYYGKDQLTIIAWDGLNDSNPAAVKVTISPVDDKPRTPNFSICLPDFEQLKITLPAVDPDDPDQALTYTITESPVQGKLTGTPPKLTYQMKSGMTITDSFKFTASDGKLTSEAGTVTIIPPSACPPSRNKKIDGKLDDWDDLPIVCTEPEEFRIDGKKCWQGIKDNQFSIGAAYNDKYLYIAVKVIDDEYNAVKEKNPWHQDGIEVRFDGRPSKLRSSNRGKGEMKDFLLFALSPNETPDSPWLYKSTKKHPEGSKFTCVKSKEGFNTEIAIPLSYLIEKGGKDWNGFRLNVCVDDRDKDGLVQIWWKPDWRGKKTYTGSGSFKITARP